MHQTICQKCGKANLATAIVCVNCGTKLAHAERKLGARLKRSALIQSLVSAPGNFLKWLWHKFKVTAYVLFFTVVLGGGGLYFFLFVPLSWGEYPLPPPVQDEKKEFLKDLQKLRNTGGFFAADPKTMRQLGNTLIFDPDFGIRRPGKRGREPVVTRQPDMVHGYFSFVKMPHDRFGLVLFQKIHGKLPFRIMAVFEVRRELNGLLELEYCRIGNLPVSAGILRKVAERMVTAWNPDQKFFSALDRIGKAEMELRHDGRDDKISLYIAADR